MYDDIPIPVGPLALGGGGAATTSGLLDLPLLAGIAVGLIIVGALALLKARRADD